MQSLEFGLQKLHHIVSGSQNLFLLLNSLAGLFQSSSHVLVVEHLVQSVLHLVSRVIYQVQLVTKFELFHTTCVIDLIHESR